MLTTAEQELKPSDLYTEVRREEIEGETVAVAHGKPGYWWVWLKGGREIHGYYYFKTPDAALTDARRFLED